jgi:c-di-GMP-related signal transduction protein
MAKEKKLTAQEQIDILEEAKYMIVTYQETFICNTILDILIKKKLVPKMNTEKFKVAKYISGCTRENAKIACKKAKVDIPLENTFAWWRYSNKISRIATIDWLIKKLEKKNVILERVSRREPNYCEGPSVNII